MATRDENLKKINDKLEQLSDEELEKVAGGLWLIDPKNPDTAGIYNIEPNKPSKDGIY